MKPEIIIHNSVSLDGSLNGFMPDMELHYQIAGQYRPDAHLIGSATVIAGNEMFGDGIPQELPGDFAQPSRDSMLPWWIIVDSGAKLKGMLHICRRFEYCRDIILLVSEATPEDYINHLKERNYSFIVAGQDKVDIKYALELLNEQYGIKKILTDTGSVLGNLLINLQLVNEISLLIHPLIIGKACFPVFSSAVDMVSLKLKKSESFANGCVWNVYSL